MLAAGGDTSAARAPADQADQPSLGEWLRAARATQGQTLQEVAAATKISLRALEAIEANEPSRLPGGIFSRSFVRTYARHLGLDPDHAVSRFLIEFPTESPTDEGALEVMLAQAAQSPARQSAPPLLAAGLLAALLVAAGVVYWLLAGQAAPAATEAAVTLEAPAAAPAVLRRPPPPDPGLAPPITDAPADGARASAEAPTDAARAVAAALERDEIELAIEAIAPCWVRLVIDGQATFARVMRPGETVTRTASQQIVFDVGDAAALRYSLNGVPGRWLGRKGQVITARISRDNLATFFQP